MAALSVTTCDVSVVICAYDEARWGDLQRAVASVCDQEAHGGVVETIVVVDHNRALHCRATEMWKDDERVRVVANAHGRGLSGARNTGVEHATGVVVAFLDDDAAAATPGWLLSLTSALDANDVVAVGGAARPVADGATPAWWPAEFNWVIGCSWIGLPSETATVRNVIGCNMAFRRDDLVAAGGFAESLGRVGTLPAGCEETDLCIRITNASPGSRVLYVPAAAVDHRVPVSRSTWRYFWRRCLAEGKSKAAVSRRNGGQRALSSERAYVVRVLPRAVLRALRDRNLRRAGAIVAGFAITTAGYALGQVRP